MGPIVEPYSIDIPIRNRLITKDLFKVRINLVSESRSAFSCYFKMGYVGPIGTPKNYASVTFEQQV